MNKWRPEGLKNPYPDLIRGGRFYGDARVWEDGADAMLEALKKRGKDCDGISPIYYCPDGRAGTLSFIPDEEEKDD